MEKGAAKREVFIIALVVAVLCIAAGIYNVWKSFERFDNSILTEKDTQLYSLMRSGDINLENSINAIERETETFLARKHLEVEIDRWKDSGSKAGLKEYISNNTLASNPIYADLVMNYKDKILCSATGNTSYTQVSGADANGLSIWGDDGGVYYLAFHQDGGGGIAYDVLIDLFRLYSVAIGTATEREVMLMDSSAVIALIPEADGVKELKIADGSEGKLADFMGFMASCQKQGIADGISVQVEDEEGKPYTARMVALPSDSTVNGVFAMGMLVNYEDAIEIGRAHV